MLRTAHYRCLPCRVVVQSTKGANGVQPAVMYEAAQPATPSEAVHVGMRDTALFDKPPLPAGQHVNSHLVSVASQLTGSDHSTLPAAEPLGRHSLTEASEVSTVAKPSSLSDGIPPAFETTSSYDGSATAAMSGIGRRFSIHLQTGLTNSLLQL